MAKTKVNLSEFNNIGEEDEKKLEIKRICIEKKKVEKNRLFYFFKNVSERRALKCTKKHEGV